MRRVKVNFSKALFYFDNHKVFESYCVLFSEIGGIGSGAELGQQFSVSQQAKTTAQLSQLENAADIKAS